MESSQSPNNSQNEENLPVSPKLSNGSSPTTKQQMRSPLSPQNQQLDLASSQNPNQSPSSVTPPVSMQNVSVQNAVDNLQDLNCQDQQENDQRNQLSLQPRNGLPISPTNNRLELADITNEQDNQIVRAITPEPPSDEEDADAMYAFHLRRLKFLQQKDLEKLKKKQDTGL